MKPLLLVSLALAAACGSSGSTGKTGSDLKSTFASKRSALLGAKPSAAPMVSAAPKPVPGAITAGTTMIEASDPSIDDTNGGDEAWTVSDVDVDGDSDADAADVLLDDESETLYVWWSGSVDLDGDGSDDDYAAFVWLDADGGVGFVIEVSGAGSIACADASAAESCVVCSDTACEAVGESADYDDSDSYEEGDDLFSEDGEEPTDG